MKALLIYLLFERITLKNVGDFIVEISGVEETHPNDSD